MTSWHRFWIGGGGALLPLLVTLLAVDLASIIDHAGEFSLGTYVGTALRYTLLFALGGFFAALHHDEAQPIKLIQLGIAAPALIASYVNAQPARTAALDVPGATYSLAGAVPHFISPVQAGEMGERPQRSIVLAGDFLSDAFRAVVNPLPAAKRPESQNAKNDAKVEQAIEEARKSAAQATMAADKAAADVAVMAQEPTPEAIAAAKRSASASSAAAQKASSAVNKASNAAAIAKQ